MVRATPAAERQAAPVEAVSAAWLREMAQAHCDHPSVDLIFNAETEHFVDEARNGFAAYRRGGGTLFQFGGVVARPEARGELLEAFVAFARGRGCRVFAVELRDGDVDLYHRHGFRLNQMGSSYTLRLKEFSLRGTRFMKLRNKLKQPAKHGVEVAELGREVEHGAAVREAIDEITRAWVRAKGWHVHLLEFMVGETSSIDRPGSRCFLALRGGRPIGFITYVPSFGRYRGLMHDLTRRLPDAPPGTMELINYTAMTRFQEEGVEHLNFGFTPFIGVQDRLGSHSRAVSRVMQLLGRHGAAVYPAAAQVAYKQKWGPSIVEPEYLAFQGRFRVTDLWRLLRMTRSV